MLENWLLTVMMVLLFVVGNITGIPRIYAKSVERLNFLFVVVDDLRPQLGAYGNTEAITPNMDRLASEGVLFERAYIQQATCAPSRASVLTGLRPDSTGIYDLETPIRQVLPNILTLPQYFKDNGYETISIGKVYHHEEDDPQGWTRPPYRAQPVTAKKGYQTPEAQAIAAANPFGPPYESADVPDNAYADGKNTDYAIQVLQEMKVADKPFFLAMGFHKPHLPFVAPSKYWDLYSRAELSLSPNPFEPEGMAPFSLTPWGELRRWYGMPKGSAPVPVDEAKHLIHGYYAATSYADAQLGRLLAELDRLGFSENTVVVLFGDHGWKLGDHAAWSKHSNFEIDTRVPFMIYVPEKARGSGVNGTRVNSLVELVDLYPTLCDLAGFPIPDHAQGWSLVPLLEDPDQPWKGYALSQFPRKPAPGGNAFVNMDEYNLTYEMLGEGVMGYGLRVAGYRYVEWFALNGGKLYPAQPFLGISAPTKELYDEQKDPLENVNVVDDPEYQETAQLLAEKLRQLLGDKFSPVWVTSPARGQTVDAVTPLRIGTSIQAYRELRIELDGMLLYAGQAVPADLKLDPTELPGGAHSLKVIAVDDQGFEHSTDSEFTVEHLRIAHPQQNELLAGKVPLTVDLKLPSDVIEGVNIALVPAFATAAETEQVYHGPVLHNSLTLDTLAYADGTYDVVVQVLTRGGTSATAQQRVIINNWDTFEDAILPPIESGWFGFTDRLRAIDRSAGWEFLGAESEAIFNDSSRIRRTTTEMESITWQMPLLHDFRFTLYTRTPDVSPAVQVEVSADGQNWASAEYASAVFEQSETGWWKVELTGEAPSTGSAAYVRFSLMGSALAPLELELGHVFLRGASKAQAKAGGKL